MTARCITAFPSSVTAWGWGWDEWVMVVEIYGTRRGSRASAKTSWETLDAVRKIIARKRTEKHCESKLQYFHSRLLWCFGLDFRFRLELRGFGESPQVQSSSQVTLSVPQEIPGFMGNFSAPFLCKFPRSQVLCRHKSDFPPPTPSTPLPNHILYRPLTSAGWTVVKVQLSITFFLLF